MANSQDRDKEEIHSSRYELKHSGNMKNLVVQTVSQCPEHHEQESKPQPSILPYCLCNIIHIIHMAPLLFPSYLTLKFSKPA